VAVLLGVPVPAAGSGAVARAAIVGPAVTGPAVTGPAVTGPGVAGPELVAHTAVTPEAVCTIDGRRLDELSGLAVAGGGYVAINDGSDDRSRRRIFYLSSTCAVRRTVSYPSRPRDTEDLAVAPDGTLWVADIGDNDKGRDTVALWKLPPGAAKPVLYRLSYPDRPHDAEALLLNGDGTPVIVTKDPFTAGLYMPARTPRAGVTTPLRRAGSFRIPQTSTGNPYGVRGRLVVTGGATAPDGSKVALRSYADAFEFPVTGGDVIAAVTTGEARVTALPDEPQGESIAYTADGGWLLTVSETSDAPPGTRPTILRYRSALPTVVPSPSAPVTASARAGRPASTSPPADSGEDARRYGGSGVAATIGAGALVLALAALGLIRRRRR
jgi:hypothetical protein